MHCAEHDVSNIQYHRLRKLGYELPAQRHLKGAATGAVCGGHHYLSHRDSRATKAGPLEALKKKTDSRNARVRRASLCPLAFFWCIIFFVKGLTF